MEQLTAGLLASAPSRLGEGPRWDARTGQVWWLDVEGRQLHRTDLATGDTTSVPTAMEIGALVPRRSGGHVAAARDGFAALQADGGLELLAAVDADDAALRMNDGSCDPRGRFYAATMAFDAAPDAGALHRLDADLSTHQVLADLTIGNGLAWSDDGGTLWYIDTTTHRVDAFDVGGAGELNNRRTAFKIPQEYGDPDGMCRDREGALWIAMHGGGTVRRFSPDGAELAVVELPVPEVTCPAFAGADLELLVIATRPGQLFVARPDVPGDCLPHAFAG